MFSLPQSETKESSEVRRSVASLLESFTCIWFGRLEKDVERKAESSAYKWIGYQVRLRRSLMNNRKRVDDGTELCETPLLIELGEELWLSITLYSHQPANFLSS